MSKVLELLDDGLGFDWDPRKPANFFILGLGKHEPECPSSPEPSPSDSLNNGAENKNQGIRTIILCILLSPHLI